jgi:membrane peptidoglycan carboxypeptidase
MKYTVDLTDKKKKRKSTTNRRKRASPPKKRTTTASTYKPKRKVTTTKSINYKSAYNSRKKKTRSAVSTKGIFTFGKTKKGKSSATNKLRTSGKLSQSAKVKKALIKFLMFSMGAMFFGGIILFFAIGLYLKNLQRSLPDPQQLVSWNPDQSTIIYDRNGKELYKFYGDENREFVPLEEIPEYTQSALLAAEDADFYQHKGIDLKGIIGCAYNGARSYLKSGSSGDFCGASTISQQLVRNTIAKEVYGQDAYLRDFQGTGIFKTGERKIKEWLLTMQVEKVFTKDEILQMYMNEIFLGGVNYGFQSASQAYFGKDVQDISVAESALLAGLIQAPTVYAPLYGLSPDEGIARKEYVLDQLVKHEDTLQVDGDLIEAARTEEIVISPATIDIKAYHFVFYVKNYLTEEFGPEIVEKGGLRVTTTLDLSTQTIAEEEIRDGLKTWGAARNTHNGSMVVLDPKTNQILAMVGSVDPFENEDKRIDGSVNITTSERQMGSSFKPFVYLTAFQKYGPWLETADIPYSFGGYKPVNWDHKFMGAMNARLALVKSRNLPATYTMQLTGIEAVLQNVEKMGVTTVADKADYGLALALGAGEQKLLEHAQAYSVFATGGIKRDVTPILKVEDSSGNILSEYEDEGTRIFDEKDIYLVNWAICDLGGFGDQAGAKYYNINGKRAICGKTGTTNGPRDLVAMQYHKNLVVAVWTGNNNNEIMGPNAWSTNVPLPIANSFMNRVSDKYKSELYTRPSGILATTVCTDTGQIPASGSTCTKASSIFVKGRAPSLDKREALTVCKDTGLISTNPTVADEFGLTLTKYLLNYKPENSLQIKTYQKYVIDKSEDSTLLITRPKEGDCALPLGEGNAPIILINSPSPGASFDAGDSISFAVTAQALGNVTSVQYYFNGTSIGTTNTAPFSFTYEIPAGTSSGNYVVSATVYDDAGKTGADSTSISVNGGIANSVSLISPSAGTTITAPITLTADATGFIPTSVTFNVKSDVGSYNQSITDSNAAGGWGVNWDGVGAPLGSYTITVTAVSGSGGTAIIVTSNPVTVNLN